MVLLPPCHEAVRLRHHYCHYVGLETVAIDVHLTDQWATAGVQVLQGQLLFITCMMEL